MKKVLSIILALIMVVSLAACTPESTNKEKKEDVAKKYTVLYNESDPVVGVQYKGLDLKGLDLANELYGSEKYGTSTAKPAGCSITFADYQNGIVGAVRNMDLQATPYCSYEFMVEEGDNVKYPFWGLAYTGMDEQSYQQVLEGDLSDNVYAMLPYTATDTMSFGLDEQGNKCSLYCAVLMRTGQFDEHRQNIWNCSGTYPGAETRCCTQSLPSVLASQNIKIDDVLKRVGAVDEDYNRIFPNDEPTIDVYTFNMPSLMWFEVVAMEDSTGRHGVLEFIDNYAIWHEGIDYSFNFFLQEDYLYNEDGTYKEQYGAGIGRYQATVPYLDYIHTVSDHVSLMDTIRYSYMTYYSEADGYIGFDLLGNPVDWRSELTGHDIWGDYIKYQSLGLDVEKAFEKFPIYAYYTDTNTGDLILIDSVEKYHANIDHLHQCWTMNYVLDDSHFDEVMTYLRWSGYLMGISTADQVKSTGSGWETYFKVIADPMECKVTRWFNEDYNTAGTITWDMVVK